MKAGHTPEKIAASLAKQAEAIRAHNVRGIETAKGWRPRNVVLLFGGGLSFVAALPLLLIATGVMYAGLGAAPHAVSTSPTAAQSSLGTPEDEQRRDAYEACFSENYAECLRLLDDANKKDPYGETRAAPINARKLALEHLKDSGR